MMINKAFKVDTPIEELHFSALKAADIQLYIKRDDLIHPFVSGNKWRKLKYNFLEAERLGVNKIATFGGGYSNHLIATAVASAKVGFKSIGIVRGDELNSNSNFVLRLCSEHGMDLQFVSRSAYKEKEQIVDDLSNQGYYVVPEGGDNRFGIIGCEEILPANHEYDHVFCAVGTGTTLRGLLRSSTGKSVIHGVAAMLEGGYLVPKIKAESDGFELHTNSAFGGFGKFDKDQLDFNRHFASQTGILLDPIYTGKMFRCVFDLIQQQYFKRKTKILCIHTGGLTGVLSERWLKA